MELITALQSCHLSTLSHPLGFPGVSILWASSVQTLAFSEMKYSRSPDHSVIRKCQPPLCLDYRARHTLQLTRKCHLLYYLLENPTIVLTLIVQYPQQLRCTV